MRLEFAPRLHPPAFVDGQFGVVVGVVAPQPFGAHRVTEGKDRGVVVGAHAALLGVDEGRAGLIFEQERNVARVQKRHVHRCCIQSRRLQFVERCRSAESQGRRCPHRLIEERRGRFVAVVLHLRFEAETVRPFAFEVQFQVPVVHHVVDVRPLPCQEHIVLVGRQVEVRGRDHVVAVRQHQVGHRILARQVFFRHERVSQFAHALPAVVFETVGQVALGKKVLVEVRRGLCREAQAQAVHIVGGDHRVHRSQIHLRGHTRVNRGFDKVFDQRLRHPNHGFRPRQVLQARHERIHALLGVG